MQTRGRKIVREISERKTRTTLMTLCIFIGVLGVVMLFSMRDILVGRFEESIDEDKLSMIKVYTSVNSDQPPDHETLFEALQQERGVEQVMGMAQYRTYFQDGAEFRETFVFAYSSPLDDLPLEPIELIDGRAPIAGQGEIAIERRLAATYGIDINDEMVFRVGDSEETWTVVGIYYEPYKYFTSMNSGTIIRGERMVFATYEDAQHLTGFTGFNLLMARYQDYPTAKQQTDSFQRTIVENSSYVPILAITEVPAQNAMVTMIRSSADALSVLAVVSMLVSGFLVYNVINAMVFEQRRQIGLMKALGATGWDNFLMYAGIALPYGVMGTVPGVLVGIYKTGAGKPTALCCGMRAPSSTVFGKRCIAVQPPQKYAQQ